MEDLIRMVVAGLSAHILILFTLIATGTIFYFIIYMLSYYWCVKRHTHVYQQTTYQTHTRLDRFVVDCPKFNEKQCGVFDFFQS